MKIDVGQIITLDVGERIRVYEVRSIYYGSIREEDVIGLKCLDKKASQVTKCTKDELLVPLCFVEFILGREKV